MQKYLGLDKVENFFKIIKQNGGILGSLDTLWRYATLPQFFFQVFLFSTLNNEYFVIYL